MNITLNAIYNDGQQRKVDGCDAKIEHSDITYESPGGEVMTVYRDYVLTFSTKKKIRTMKAFSFSMDNGNRINEMIKTFKVSKKSNFAIIKFRFANGFDLINSTPLRK